MVYWLGLWLWQSYLTVPTAPYLKQRLFTSPKVKVHLAALLLGLQIQFLSIHHCPLLSPLDPLSLSSIPSRRNPHFLCRSLFAWRRCPQGIQLPPDQPASSLRNPAASPEKGTPLAKSSTAPASSPRDQSPREASKSIRNPRHTPGVCPYALGPTALLLLLVRLQASRTVEHNPQSRTGRGGG
jgi:hypothetical protein